jgi:hypothetical protein
MSFPVTSQRPWGLPATGRRLFALFAIAVLLLPGFARAADWKPDPGLNLPDQRVKFYKIARRLLR